MASIIGTFSVQIARQQHQFGDCIARHEFSEEFTRTVGLEVGLAGRSITCSDLTLLGKLSVL